MPWSNVVMCRVVARRRPRGLNSPAGPGVLPRFLHRCFSVASGLLNVVISDAVRAPGTVEYLRIPMVPVGLATKRQVVAQTGRFAALSRG